jgi:hypothetical protein
MMPRLKATVIAKIASAHQQTETLARGRGVRVASNVKLSVFRVAAP